MTFAANLFSRKFTKENPKLPIRFPFHRKSRNTYHNFSKLKNEIRLLLYTEHSRQTKVNMELGTWDMKPFLQSIETKRMPKMLNYKFNINTNE